MNKWSRIVIGSVAAFAMLVPNGAALADTTDGNEQPADNAGSSWFLDLSQWFGGFSDSTNQQKADGNGDAAKDGAAKDEAAKNDSAKDDAADESGKSASTTNTQTYGSTDGAASSVTGPASSQERAMLNQEIANAEKVDLSKYKDDGQKTFFQQSLENAKRTAEDKNATSVAVITAYYVLKQASTGLTPKDDSSQGTDPGTKPSDPNTKEFAYTFIVNDPKDGHRLSSETREFEEGQQVNVPVHTKLAAPLGYNITGWTDAAGKTYDADLTGLKATADTTLTATLKKDGLNIDIHDINPQWNGGLNFPGFGTNGQKTPSKLNANKTATPASTGTGQQTKSDKNGGQQLATTGAAISAIVVAAVVLAIAAIALILHRRKAIADDIAAGDER
ncbi:hypothetical protein KIH77_02355 [Bifidobacterium sp. 82T24]|uniref:hypothetical protein n=1 Tax=Bifidobacterium pluvialisilvae TaxID=2834436 RepID=UPI001C573E34|nr:hypothetical protein [Bifidobacterium pluvialisilvae]MBW3087583.1 hypothetical protein [Bifidobacterium pluvialisilvae]